jgi:soluble lytic murein transglycosylase
LKKVVQVIFPFKRITGLSILALALAVPGLASAKPAKHVAEKPQKSAARFINDDDIFMALREAALRDDAAKTGQLAARLPDYAIPSYIDYYKLKPRMRSAGVSEIRDFLRKYEGSAIADRLRNDWLLELGHRRDWTAFDEQYPQFVVDDDIQVKCYALMSRAIKGKQVADDARALLASPKDYGNACNSLISVLSHNGQFSSDDLWAQIRLAAENGSTPAAKKLAALADADEKLVERAIDKPTLVLTRGIGKSREAHAIFIIALGRAARSNPELAVHALEGALAKMSDAEQAQGWAGIALQSSYRLAPETYSQYWVRAGDAPLSVDGYAWRARMALRGGDWKLVKAAIEAMPASLRSHPSWTYWMARALRDEGKVEESTKMFRSIADQHQFYGQLAQEELGLKISIPLGTQPLTAAELTPMSTNAGLKRAIKFFDMNLRFEGVREWNWELRKMNEREHLAAAEYARQNNLLDRMVSTSDRTKSEVDFTQRFPSPFRDFMYNATSSLGLDMAWVYGLIRQESRFIQNAKSTVGASGLMQLMPGTATYVARKIGMSDYSHKKVNETDTNIQLGTNYLNIVLRDLDGSQALATAAYNAGPGRPRAWRATLTHSVEGAIFAETIPFNETRAYVKNVLSNATYYAALFEGKPQSLKARLGTVAPKGIVDVAQP